MIVPLSRKNHHVVRGERRWSYQQNNTQTRTRLSFRTCGDTWPSQKWPNPNPDPNLNLILTSTFRRQVEAVRSSQTVSSSVHFHTANLFFFFKKRKHVFLRHKTQDLSPRGSGLPPPQDPHPWGALLSLECRSVWFRRSRGAALTCSWMLYFNIVSRLDDCFSVSSVCVLFCSFTLMVYSFLIFLCVSEAVCTVCFKKRCINKALLTYTAHKTSAFLVCPGRAIPPLLLLFHC